MGFIIYTERYLGNGSVHREQYKCKAWSKDNGILEFFNDKLDEHSFLSIHKMDSIMIKTIDDNSVVKEDDIRV